MYRKQHTHNSDIMYNTFTENRNTDHKTSDTRKHFMTSPKWYQTLSGTQQIDNNMEDDIISNTNKSYKENDIQKSYKENDIQKSFKENSIYDAGHFSNLKISERIRKKHKVLEKEENKLTNDIIDYVNKMTEKTKKDTDIKNIINNNNNNMTTKQDKIEVSEKEERGDIKIDDDDNNIDIKKSQYEFCRLSFEDIQVNLRLLSDLKEGEKLMITENRYAVVDNRYINSLWRMISSDSRLKSFDFIIHVIQETQNYCNNTVNNINNNIETEKNMKKLVNLQSLLEQTIEGLTRLTETYSDDKLSRAKLRTIQKTITTFKEQDLDQALKKI
jgi:hypothetical protein